MAPGVVTPGGWDLRPTAARLPWPRSLDGLRCLDVGAMDGFWAFEMERRGAREVLAIDLDDPARQDAPAGLQSHGPTAPEHLRGATFRCAAALLGSRAEHRDLSVYDLRPVEVGRFHLVVMGYVLQMLRDPLRALEAVRWVCSGHLVLLDTFSAPLSLLPSPLARLNARRGHLEWLVFNRLGLARAVEMAGYVVEERTGILPDHAGPGAGRLPRAVRPRHALGILGRSAALRARPALYL